MKKTLYENNLKDSLNQFTPDVLDKIKESKQFYVPEKPEKTAFYNFSFKRLGYTFASLIILFVLVLSLQAKGVTSPVIASTVTIDINPSILIELDEDDFVVNVSAINDDGNTLIDRDIKYKGITLDKAVEYLLFRAYQLGYIVEGSTDNVVLINVNSDQASVKERLEVALQTRVQTEMAKYQASVQVEKGNTENVSGNQLSDLETRALYLKISVAKLMLINQIIELDDSYQIQDLKDNSIRELYNLKNALENPTDESNTNPGNGNPNN